MSPVHWLKNVKRCNFLKDKSTIPVRYRNPAATEPNPVWDLHGRRIHLISPRCRLTYGYLDIVHSVAKVFIAAFSIRAKEK